MRAVKNRPDAELMPPLFLPHHLCHALDVIRVWEHVHRLKAIEAETEELEEF